MKMPRGAYPADRAAALAGVPVSTVRWWARNEVLEPSVSPERVMLWSYADLMGLRIIYWLRQPKSSHDATNIPRSTMRAVRKALGDLRDLDMALWSEDGGPGVRVDRAGQIHILHGDTLMRSRDGAVPLDPDLLDVLDPFEAGRAKGPDLVAPRPQLRIVPGKLSGSPHIVHTRLESQALGGLAAAGLVSTKIYRLYPDVGSDVIDEALDLERQLASNLAAA